MSKTPDTNDGAQIRDEENRIDKRLKDRILDARERVAEREDDIYVGAPLEAATDPNVALTQDDLNQLWTTPVKQYLKAIEPLLRSDEIPDAEYYYQEIPLLNTPVLPADGPTRIWDPQKDDNPQIENIEWSALYDMAPRQREQNYGFLDKRFQPPEPKKATLTGLKDVIEKDGFEFEWHVTLNPGALPPHQIDARPTRTISLKQQWLEAAVREADMFLKNAGVGLEVGQDTTPEKSRF